LKARDDCLIIMKSILPLLVLICGAGNLIAQAEKPSRLNPEDTAEFTVSKDAHLAKLILRLQGFCGLGTQDFSHEELCNN
jgi:hypothetical protein